MPTEPSILSRTSRRLGGSGGLGHAPQAAPAPHLLCSWKPEQALCPSAGNLASREQDWKELGLPGKAEGVRTAWTLSSPERPVPLGGPGGPAGSCIAAFLSPRRLEELAQARCPPPF